MRWYNIDIGEGNTVEEYAIGLVRAWGVGKKQKDNGIVLLVAPNERRARIETGYKIEPYLTDGETGRIIREKLVPAFQQKDYAGGILAGADAIIEKLSKASEESEQANSGNDTSGGRWPRLVVVLVIIGVVLLLVFLSAVSDESGGRRNGGSDGFFFGGGWTSGGSGGDSDGGGFNGFGGGSFGGGGASGSW